MDVAVIGGGIVGMASAYYLARRGAEVTVLERSTVGSGNTERSAGGIRTQFGERTNIRLAAESVAVWDRFEEAFDADIGFHRSGYLFLARDAATAERLRANVEAQNELGVDNAFLSPEEAVEVCPGLRPGAIVGAAYSPDDGFADPHLALGAYAGAAREAGVEIATNTEVTDVIREGGEVSGVETGGGRLEVDYVVNAAGAWAGRVAAIAGIDLPLSARRVQIAVVDPERPVPTSVPMTLDPGTDAYFHPDGDGTALVGGGPSVAEDPTADPDRFSTSLDASYAAEVLSRVSEFAEYFGPDSRVESGWAGLICMTPDHDPVIEETVPGFVNAVGFSGHGFMLAPAVGQVVSELVTEGEPSLVDVSGFTSDRFADDAGRGHRWLSS